MQNPNGFHPFYSDDEEDLDTLPPAAGWRAAMGPGGGGASARPAPSRLGRGGSEFELDPAVRAQFKRKTGRAESPSDTARNPRSSAEGRYQFTDGTWLSYYPIAYGDTGETRAQILAKRRNGEVQEPVMDALIDDNARQLRKAGFEVDAGNLYLAHFAGWPTALKILRNPGASAVSLFGKKAADANPFIKRMSGQDVIDWAHRRMR